MIKEEEDSIDRDTRGELVNLLVIKRGESADINSIVRDAEVLFKFIKGEENE